MSSRQSRSEACKIVRRLDERDAGKGLREITDETLGWHVVLLRQQPDIITDRERALEQAAPFVLPPKQDRSVCELKEPCEK